MCIAYFCENDHRWDSEQVLLTVDQKCPVCEQSAYRYLNLDYVKTFPMNNQEEANVCA